MAGMAGVAREAGLDTSHRPAEVKAPLTTRCSRAVAPSLREAMENPGPFSQEDGRSLCCS